MQKQKNQTELACMINPSLCIYHCRSRFAWGFRTRHRTWRRFLSIFAIFAFGCSRRSKRPCFTGKTACRAYGTCECATVTQCAVYASGESSSLAFDTPILLCIRYGPRWTHPCTIAIRASETRFICDFACSTLNAYRSSICRRSPCCTYSTTFAAFQTCKL